MTWVIARLAIIVVVLQFIAISLNVSQAAVFVGSVVGCFIGEVLYVYWKRRRK